MASFGLTPPTLQFALSYTDWMCYAMLVVKFTVHPSALTMLPPLTIFTYALLVEAPSRSYWYAAPTPVPLSCCAVCYAAMCYFLFCACQMHFLFCWGCHFVHYVVLCGLLPNQRPTFLIIPK